MRQGLLAKDGSTHIGIRATSYSAEDFHDSEKMGIATLTADDVHKNGVDACVDVVRRRWEGLWRTDRSVFYRQTMRYLEISLIM